VDSLHQDIPGDDPDYKKLPIRSFEDYQVVQDNVKYSIKSNPLFLKKEIAGRFDVLRVGVDKYHTYVTETVKKQMEDIGFTGIEYIPADDLIVG